MNAIICLVEGSYWAGMTAIINSAIRNNFSGCIYVGYRGALPAWLSKFKQATDNKNHIISDQICLKLTPIVSQRNLGYEKPFFISEIIHQEPIDNLFYFDVDCVALADFNFYLKWCNKHIAVCEDECFSTIHINHPWKVYWGKKLVQYNFPINGLTHPYINSGFIGLSKTNFDTIEIWKDLTEKMESEGLNTKKFNKNPLLPIQGDQEILNMALITKNTEQLSVIGKEGMGFSEPCYLMAHCTKPEKPWAKNFTLSFMKNGYPISAREKKYFDFLTSPYNNLGKSKILIKKIDIFITKIASRIF